jgi:hypothetical protein
MVGYCAVEFGVVKVVSALTSLQMVGRMGCTFMALQLYWSL